MKRDKVVVITWAVINLLTVLSVWVLLQFTWTAKFWAYWESAAIASEIVYTLLFFVAFLGFKPAIGDYVDGKGGLIAGVVVFIGCGLVAFAGFKGLYERSFVCQTALLTLGAAAFAIVDWFLGRNIKPTKGSDKEFGKRMARGFNSALIYSDLPIAACFLVLTITAAFLDRHPDLYVEATVRAFLAGAIAFQMLISNTIYGILFWPSGKTSPGNPPIPTQDPLTIPSS